MKKIGLLGGSFDPPHKGHLFISLEAKRLLKLDEVWWIVTPQNPLKILKMYSTRQDIRKEVGDIINGHSAQSWVTYVLAKKVGYVSLNF